MIFPSERGSVRTKQRDFARGVIVFQFGRAGVGGRADRVRLPPRDEVASWREIPSVKTATTAASSAAETGSSKAVAAVRTRNDLVPRVQV